MMERKVLHVQNPMCKGTDEESLSQEDTDPLTSDPQQNSRPIQYRGITVGVLPSHPQLEKIKVHFTKRVPRLAIAVVGAFLLVLAVVVGVTVAVVRKDDADNSDSSSDIIEAVVIFSTTFPNLDAAVLTDTRFVEQFKLDFRRAVASAAGDLPLGDVVVDNLSAGSVVVESTVNYRSTDGTDTGSREVALGNFIIKLESDPSSIFANQAGFETLVSDSTSVTVENLSVNNGSSPTPTVQSPASPTISPVSPTPTPPEPTTEAPTTTSAPTKIGEVRNSTSTRSPTAASPVHSPTSNSPTSLSPITDSQNSTTGSFVS
eukprot:CAMPEP_0118954636 /NCGR_PEP_ID=MMETSP1169-20130426/58584_1 /TAXON_ID=36882 /ORGANISM="Pyramimonas obovata, Strain CCMP722" /LENGTH=316 /DNA_ID=CAMNT_0006902303 /DNA_START=138 /DNA_END=1084 /DNA_ORIENTATION=+